ncbi:MAG: 3-keto-disaccharide hydrolase [Chthonomonadales bacterium]
MKAWTFFSMPRLAVIPVRRAATGGMALAFLLGSQRIAPTYAMQGADEGRRPPGALVLFDGRDAREWVHLRTGKPVQWLLEDGALVVQPRTGDIVTIRRFRDFRLHLEFQLPSPGPDDPEHGNSGVILHNLYEVQIINSFGRDRPGSGDCGAIYRQAAPEVNACKAPGEWQSLDVVFRAPRFDAAGKMLQPACVTVWLNGSEIHRDRALLGPTGSRKGLPITAVGPVVLQDHRSRVRFRNIWVVPLRRADPAGAKLRD